MPIVANLVNAKFDFPIDMDTIFPLLLDLKREARAIRRPRRFFFTKRFDQGVPGITE